MGLTVHYKAVFSTSESLAVKRRKMESLALDAAKEWAAFLGLPEPEIWSDNKGAILDLNTGAETFDLWKPVIWDWEGCIKTQYAESPLAHVQVVMIVKALVDSDLFVPDSIDISDEGEFFGNWYNLDIVVDALAGNRKTINGMVDGLKAAGWNGADIEDHPNERTTSTQREIFKAALDHMLTEKDKIINDLAEHYAMRYNECLTLEFDKIRYPYVINRARDLQSDIAVFLYRFDIEELINGVHESAILRFAEKCTESCIKAVKKWWKPEYAESRLA